MVQGQKKRALNEHQIPYSVVIDQQAKLSNHCITIRWPLKLSIA